MHMSGTHDGFLEAVLELCEQMRELKAFVVVDDGHSPDHLAPIGGPSFAHEALPHGVPDSLGARSVPLRRMRASKASMSSCGTETPKRAICRTR